MFIWVPRKLDELKGRRGLFEVEESVGKKLIEQGLAQDPKVGAAKLEPISDEPAKRKVSKRKKKVVTEDDVEAKADSDTLSEQELFSDVPADKD